LFSFGKKKGAVLGLDLNSDSITLLQLDKSRAGIEITKYACLTTPGNAIREGLITDPESLGLTVQQLLVDAGFGTAGPSPTINITVPAQAVVIRLMPVPVGMPPDELADVVTQEATNHVPFPIEDANLDWCAMPATERTDADGVRRIDIILCAIQRSIIESYWRLADTAGVKLGRVDISSLAVVRSLALAGYLGSAGHLSMVVNVRHDATDINIVRSAMPLFGRSIMIGLDTLTEALSRSLNLNFDQALELIPEIVLFGVPPADVKLGQAAQVSRTVFSDITDELVRSLDFYKSQVGDVKVDQIILSGPGCMVQNLDTFIGNRMNLRTLICDPMRDLVFEPDMIVDSIRPILAALVGSSIEPGWNPSFTVDLDLNKEGRLPLFFDERKTMKIAPEPAKAGWFKPAVLALSAIIALSLGAWAYLSLVAVPNAGKELKAITLELENNKNRMKALNELRKDNDSLKAKKQTLDALVRRNSHWSDVLNEIRNSIPSGAQITAISLDASSYRIEGEACDFTNVSDFAVALNEVSMFKGGRIDSATRSTTAPEKVLFQISGGLQNVLGDRAEKLVASNPTESGKTPIASPGEILQNIGNTLAGKAGTEPLNPASAKGVSSK
jgi:type IV pilus assembly protein PilM